MPLNRKITRRQAIGTLAAIPLVNSLTPLASLVGSTVGPASSSSMMAINPRFGWEKTIEKGLAWLAKQQTRSGGWPHDTYPAAMTALSGIALICSGSTTTQGPYAKNIRNTVNYLLTKTRKNGLIGDPKRDDRYT